MGVNAWSEGVPNSGVLVETLAIFIIILFTVAIGFFWRPQRSGFVFLAGFFLTCQPVEVTSIVNTAVKSVSSTLQMTQTWNNTLLTGFLLRVLILSYHNRDL